MIKPRAIRQVVVHALLKATGLDIKADYIRSAPSDQNAIDLFSGEWTSRLPGPFTSGVHQLFDDHRMTWLVHEVEGLRGMSVLDCGPLEGGHAYMLERAGADVVAVEANTHAFLRCLVAKEVLGMEARFRLGDFVAFLHTGPRFDLIVASGVLYHLTNPVEALALASRATDRLYLWTHYYQPEHVSRSMRFDAPRSETVEGFEHTLYRHHYPARLGNPNFLGGTQASSSWMTRSDLLGSLAFFGFDHVRVQFDRTDTHPAPSISLLAERRGTGRPDSNQP